MKENREHIIFDGKILPAGEPVTGVSSRGLMYGEGVFETFRVYSGKTLFLEKHLQRLKDGLKVLGILWPVLLDIHKLKPLIADLLLKNNLPEEEALVRLQVWRNGRRGYGAEANSDSHFSVTASPVPPDFKNPVLATVDTRRIPSKALPSGYKFSNGINYILAAGEASRKGADDALMLTVDDKISETTIANVFWVRDKTFYTPSACCDIIPGITRSIVMDLTDGYFSFEEGKFDLKDIFEADSVFLTNSIREILPVRAVDDHFFDTDNPAVEELKKHFSAFRNNHLNPLHEG